MDKSFEQTLDEALQWLTEFATNAPTVGDRLYIAERLEAKTKTLKDAFRNQAIGEYEAGVKIPSMVGVQYSYSHSSTRSYTKEATQFIAPHLLLVLDKIKVTQEMLKALKSKGVIDQELIDTLNAKHSNVTESLRFTAKAIKEEV
jgi:hypothetical protein